jgi:beta-lactamase class A
MNWLDILERRLKALADGVRADWSVYVRFLAGSEEITINADRMQDTMSLIKVPILIALMRRVERGEADLSKRLTLTDDHKRLGTGVLFLFDAGASLTLKDAAWLMTVVSDNTATDICLEAAGGVEGVNAEMQALGIPDIRMTGDALTWFRALGASMDPNLGTVAPGEFARRGYPPLGVAELSDARESYHFKTGQPFSLASARGLGLLLTQLHESRCAESQTCATIRGFLLGQQLQTMVPKYVWGVTAAHKTGGFQPFIASDVGIFTPASGSPAIICIMSQRYRGQRALLEDTVARMGELVIHTAEAYR